MASSSGSPANDVFDVRKVRKFIELMNEHDLAEIDLRQADQRIRLRRGPEIVNVAPTSAPAPAAPPTPVAQPASAPPAASDATSEEANVVLIRSPMVGTFYSSPNPESPPFVKVGDGVGPETTVCIVEAMKVFNEIPAECTGRIIAVLAQSGDAIEFNQPLFRVEPA